MANPTSPTPPKPANDVAPTVPAIPADKPEPRKQAGAPGERAANGTVPGESVAGS